MTNTDIKRYLKNELLLMERVKFIEELENDMFLKESIEGLKMWIENNKHSSDDELDKELDKLLPNIIKPQ